MSDQLQNLLTDYPEWFHSIELSPGVVTPGRKTAQRLQNEWSALRLPDLHGKSVLDIGAYDGYFSFAAEKAGAASVVALDHYVWSADMAEYMKDWRESRRAGVDLPTPQESRHWHPATLPGKKPFDFAHKTLASHVKSVVGDFMTMDITTLGKFDVVFYLGVLYHMEDPLSALKRLAQVVAPGGWVVIETEAMEIPGVGGRACCEFFPGRERNNDPSNWWAPNARAIQDLCRAAGFKEAHVLRDRNFFSLAKRFYETLRVSGPAYVRELLAGRWVTPLKRYRAIAHARI